MTREEAIIILENISVFQQPDSNYRKALDIAIKALEHESKTVNKYCDAERLNYIREYIVNNIMRESDIMNNEDCRNVVDLPEVIASLYELLHLIVTNEPYEYMFHWANKCGSWVDDDLFTEQYDRRYKHEQ